MLCPAARQMRRDRWKFSAPSDLKASSREAHRYPTLSATGKFCVYLRGDNAFHYDCLLERGGFEPPRPFRI